MPIDEKMKLSLFKHLLDLEQKPFKAVNERQTLWSASKAKVRLSEKELEELIAFNEGADNNCKELLFTGKVGAFDKNRIGSGAGFSHITNEEDKALLESIPIIHRIIFEAIIFEAVTRTAELMYLQGDDVTYIKTLENELKQLACNVYLLPRLRAINQGYNMQQALEAGANVVAVCESQMRAGNVPEAYHSAVYQLAEETVKAMAGDSKNYQSYVDVIPHKKYEWAKIIFGAAATFIGALMAIGSIPLIAVGGTGALIGAAGLTLSICGATLFAESVFKKDIRESAEKFHKQVSLGSK